MVPPCSGPMRTRFATLTASVRSFCVDLLREREAEERADENANARERDGGAVVHECRAGPRRANRLRHGRDSEEECGEQGQCEDGRRDGLCCGPHLFGGGCQGTAL